MSRDVKKPKIHAVWNNNGEMNGEVTEMMEKFKEKQLTPMEMDLKIQADRVVYIINRTLAKINIMAHLPAFLENNAALLRKYLKKTELHFILSLLNRYGTNFEVLLNEEEDYHQYIAILEKLNSSTEKMSLSYKNADTAALTSDPAVTQMIDIIFYNKCLRQSINNNDNENQPKHVDIFLANLLRVLEEFKNVAKMKLYVTGDEEDATDKELRRAYKANVLLTASIKDLTEQLEEQRKELGDQLNQKVAIFDKYNKKMETLTDEFKLQMQKNLIDSERLMMHKSLESEQTQAELSENAKKLVAQYNALLEEHLAHEKQSRAKRLKAETLLQSWLTKFDQEIGDKQAEYELLKKEYDEKRAKIEELEELLDEQEDEYNTLMEEKRIEEERIANEIANEFSRNRAARIIQKYWRAYKERRAARRKGRKAVTKKAEGDIDTDPNKILEANRKIKGHVFDELENPDAKFEEDKN